MPASSKHTRTVLHPDFKFIIISPQNFSKDPLEGQRVAWSRGLIFPSYYGHGILQSDSLVENRITGYKPQSEKNIFIPKLK
jgi:hypothetical protein